MELQYFQDEIGQFYVGQAVDFYDEDGGFSEDSASVADDSRSSGLITTTYPHEDWSVVGSTIVVGLAVVFFILAVLVFVFWLFGKVFSKHEVVKTKINSNSNSDSESASNVLPGGVTPSVTPKPPAVSSGVPGEVVAAITAAVTAYGADTGRKLRVAGISEKRRGFGRGSWSQAGVFESVKR